MRKFTDLTEAKGQIIFAFGRFNPPTTGHEKLISKVAQVSGSSPYRIYPSFSQNPKKDPLPHTLKVAYMRKMFPKHARSIVADKDAKTAINVAVKLYDEGFRDLVMVAGSDRVKEFSSLLKTYNGVEGKRHGFYKFDTIDVVSAGERDPDAEGVEGMSASKMRAAAVDGDFDSFQQGLPKGFRDAKKLYNDVRKYMGIREERHMGEMDEQEMIRDAYLTGKIWNVGDVVEAKGITGKVIRKGTNYIAFHDEEGKVHKAWLHEVKFEDLPSDAKTKLYTLYSKGMNLPAGSPAFKKNKKEIEALRKKYKLDERELTDSKRVCIGVIDIETKKLLGLCSAWLILDELHITSIAVDPIHQRKGLGKFLLSDLIKRSSLLQTNRIYLEVKDTNEPAKAFYKAMGFKIVGNRFNFYNDGSDALIFTKQLNKKDN